MTKVKESIYKIELNNTSDIKLVDKVHSVDSSSPNSTNDTPFTGVEMQDDSKKMKENLKEKSATDIDGKNKVLSDGNSNTQRRKFLGFSFHNDKKDCKKNKVYNTPKTPFGLNKFVLVFGYSIYTFICGCPYWGWNGIQEMLYKSGAFAEDCDSFSPVSYLTVGNSIYKDCPARQQKINNLYTIAFAAHFVSSAFMGVVLDRIGPKLTSFVGLSLAFMSWILLAFAEGLGIVAYFFAAAFMGMSADPCYFPLLSVSNIFPGYESLVMSVLGSVRSCSFAIPVILSLIFTNSDSYKPSDFWMFCIGYVGVGLGIATFIAVFLIPMRTIKLVEDKEELIDAVRRKSLHPESKKPCLSITALELEEIECNEKKSQGFVEERKASFAKFSNTNLTENQNLMSDEEASSTKRESFINTIKQAEFFLILPFFCLTLIRVEFFTKSNKNQLIVGSSDVFKMFSIMNILSFLPGPVFGILCDYIGVLPVLFILNIFGVLMYLFLIFNNLACKALSICCYFLFCSFCLSNLYCYVGAIFPPEHFGKLSGLASMAAGLFSLTSYLWYYISSDLLLSLSPYNFAVVDGIMIVFGFINLVIWIFMYQIRKAKLKKKKIEALHVVKV